MGIPYSKEINKAFEELNKAYGQVTPLIEAAYEVLETTKNISLMLFGLEILSVILLSLILLALVGLLITMNPDLDRERKELVTPVLQWVAGWASMGKKAIAWFGTAILVLVIIITGLVALGTRYGDVVREQDGQQETGEETGEEGQDGDGDKDDKEGKS